MGLRGQAEIISTVIIVSVAVAIALSVIYYLIPVLTQNRVLYQLQATLAEIAAGTRTGVVYEGNYTVNGTDVYTVVFSLSNLGTVGEVAYYAAVMAFTEDMLPVGWANYTMYRLNGTAAPAAVNDTGWVSLAADAFPVPPGLVYLYIRDGYYRVDQLRTFDPGFGPARLTPLGIIKPGEAEIFRADIYDYNSTSVRYALVVFVEANGNFFEVRRIYLRG